MAALRLVGAPPHPTQQQVHTMSRLLYFTPAFLLLGMGFLFAPIMMLDAPSLASSQVWALWTGHFLHWTPGHFFWDWALFLFCLWMLADSGWRVWGWVLAALPVLSLVIFLWRPDMWEYRGLSGIDTVLFTRIAVGFFQDRLNPRGVRWLGGLALIGLLGKIIWEFSSGGAFFSGDLGPGNTPLPEIHVAGVVIGLIWALWERVRRKVSWAGNSDPLCLEEAAQSDGDLHGGRESALSVAIRRA